MIHLETTEVVLTNSRVLLKTGLIARRVTEMGLGKVETVLLDESLLGRLFRYASVSVGVYGGGILKLYGIEHPMEFRAAVQKAVMAPRQAA